MLRAHSQASFAVFDDFHHDAAFRNDELMLNAALKEIKSKFEVTILTQTSRCYTEQYKHTANIMQPIAG